MEIVERELDANLLLAFLAAARGFDVLITDKSSLRIGSRFGCWTGGIAHTKDLDPTPDGMLFRKELLESGLSITSQDAESGVQEWDFSRLARRRYAPESVNQSEAVFCWGDSDFDCLSRTYREQKRKFLKTGSPRIDLLLPRLRDYWIYPNRMPSRPYVLIAPSLGTVNGRETLCERVQQLQIGGYLDRDPDSVRRLLHRYRQQAGTIHGLIQAITEIGSTNRQFDIVVRPHPTERVDTWETLLQGLPNVHVIREGPIAPWILGSFAFVHTGSTAALEAKLVVKDVVSFEPVAIDETEGVPTAVSKRVEDSRDLVSVLLESFEESRVDSRRLDLALLPDAVRAKIHLQDEMLSAEKIVDTWNGLGSGLTAGEVKWGRLRVLLRAHEVQVRTSRPRSRFLPFLPSRKVSTSVNWKFPAFHEATLRSQLSRLRYALNVEAVVEMHLISQRAVLIRHSR